MDAVDRTSPPIQVGERWVIRHRLADGSATDVVGWVENVGAERVTVLDYRGDLTTVRRSSVVVSRRAPVAMGGRDPLRTPAAELEQLALTGWAAHREPLGEWTLRAAGGFTGRANSCLAVGDPKMPVPQAAERITAFSAEHHILPRAQVIKNSEPEQQLRGLGWVEVYVATDVLVTRLASLLGDTRPDPRVRIKEDLDPAWWDAYQISRPNTADPKVLRQILAGNPPRAFAGVEDGGLLIGIGRAHVSAGWMGVGSIWTHTDCRRQGWASLVLLGLGHWAARLGARNVYLQVAVENQAAHLAYERLGFSQHHSYIYLAPNSGSSQAHQSRRCRSPGDR